MEWKYILGYRLNNGRGQLYLCDHVVNGHKKTRTFSSSLAKRFDTFGQALKYKSTYLGSHWMIEPV